jgi:hypothetical protein
MVENNVFMMSAEKSFAVLKVDVMTLYGSVSYRGTVAERLQDHSRGSQNRHFSSQKGEQNDHFTPIPILMIFVMDCNDNCHYAPAIKKLIMSPLPPRAEFLSQCARSKVDGNEKEPP